MNELILQIGGPVLTALSAWLAAWYAYRGQDKSSTTEAFDLIFNTLQEENKALREEIAKMKVLFDQSQEKYFELDKNFNRLRDKIVLLESAHMDMPIPMWLKDTNGVMLALNAAYEQLFLMPNGLTADDYIGHTDIDVWGDEIGKIYQDHDRYVYRTGRIFDGDEVVEIKGERELYRIIKYPRYSGKTKVGIAGIAIPKYAVA